MPQFFIESKNIENNYIKLNQKQDIKHISEVLRCKLGSKILLVDEDEILYECTIENISKELLTAKIIKKEKSIRRLQTQITLIESIIKSSAQDIIIQKATELGVQNIQPITTDYSVVKFNNEKEKNKKIERWQKIANESCKQCERSKMPTVKNILSLEEVLEVDFDIKIACVERQAEQSIKNFLRSKEYKNESIAIFIGPEGGWSDKEIELFNKYNIQKVSLGNLILRAETAAINAVSSVVYEYEN